MFRPFIPLVPLALAVGSCAIDTGPPTGSSRPTYLTSENDLLRERLAVCEKRTGYAPSRAEELGPYQFGRGELAWRHCAYAALTEIIVPATAFPELYAGLIEQDKQLTRMIPQRKVTREARAQRINQMLARIREAELAETERRDPSLVVTDRDKFLMESTAVLINNIQTLR